MAKLLADDAGVGSGPLSGDAPMEAGADGGGAGEMEDSIVGQVAVKKIGDPKSEAIGDDQGAGRFGGKGSVQVDGFFDGRSAGRALGPMGGDAGGHFGVAGLGGGDEGDRAGLGGS